MFLRIPIIRHVGTYKICAYYILSVNWFYFALTGNIEFQPRKLAYHHDEAVSVKNIEVVQIISELLRVKQETLLAALTAKRARASGEILVINYKLHEVSTFACMRMYMIVFVLWEKKSIRLLIIRLNTIPKNRRSIKYNRCQCKVIYI